MALDAPRAAVEPRGGTQLRLNNNFAVRGPDRAAELCLINIGFRLVIAAYLAALPRAAVAFAPKERFIGL